MDDPRAVIPHPPHPTLDEIERRAILARMRRLGGRKPEVAASLGVRLKTLYSKLNRYILEDRDDA